jgi:hypothetical protein
MQNTSLWAPDGLRPRAASPPPLPVTPAAPATEVTARGSRRLHLLLFTLFVAGAIGLLVRGLEFYSLNIRDRVDHPDFRVLGPGSNLGHGYGIAGTALILTNLLYLVRRRFARLSIGSLRAWLDVHVFTGLFGGLLVLFHSAFQARNGVAVVTVGSLGVVIGTGLLGRYLYSLSPRPDPERLRRGLLALNAIGPGLGEQLHAGMGRVDVTPPPARRSLLAVLVLLPSYWRELRQRRRVIDQVVAYYTPHYRGELALLGKPLAECRSYYAAEVRAGAARALLESWRGLHRFAALLMVLLVAMHIAVAWYYGFVWVFSE